jgi:hypothetical protein
MASQPISVKGIHATPFCFFDLAATEDVFSVQAIGSRAS